MEFIRPWTGLRLGIEVARDMKSLIGHHFLSHEELLFITGVDDSLRLTLCK